MQEALYSLYRSSLTEELGRKLSLHLENFETGNYYGILTDQLIGLLVGREDDEVTKEISLDDFENWQDFVTHRLCLLLRSLGSEQADFNSHFFFIAAFAAINAFLQSNVTGPVIPFSSTKLLFPPDISQNKKALSTATDAVISALSIDGVAAYKLTPNVELFCLARIILEHTNLAGIIPAASWLGLRVDFLHQRLLAEVSPTLQKRIYSGLEKVSALASGELDNKGTKDAFTAFILERATIHLHHGLDKEAKEDLLVATKARSFEFAITGLMGKRTKFQQRDTSQLVVLAKSREEGSQAQEALDPSIKGNDTTRPDTLDLNDDTLLESIIFTDKTVGNVDELQESNLSAALSQLDPSAQPKLGALDSIILLLTASSITNTNPADGLTREETLPYATRVLDGGSSNWQVYTQALLLRSRIEGYSSRKVERGLLQLQALVDQVIADTTGSSSVAADVESLTGQAATSFFPKLKDETAASVNDRLLYIYQLCSPYRWDLEAELASRWVSLGGLRSAMEIYTRLQMWPEAALCLAATDKEDKAVRMVRRQLFHATKPSEEVDENAEKWEGEERNPPPQDAPRLYCILGDINRDVAMYEKAWSVSGQRYARAQRSLGRHYWAEREYDKAALAYNQALKIRQLDHATWFALGCCLLELSQFTSAAEAFSRAVQMDDTDAESWSNLAAALLRLDPPTAEHQDISQPASSDIPISSVDGAEEDFDDEGGQENVVDSQKHVKDALHALRQAQKHAPTNYRILANVLTVAARLEPPSWTDVLTSQSRIIDLRSATEGEGCIDIQILSGLIDHIIALSAEPFTSKDATGSPRAEGTYDPTKPGLIRMTVQLLDQKVVPLITASPELWLLMADVYVWRRKPSSALAAHEKAWRIVNQRPNWENSTEEKDWDAVVDATVSLIGAYERFGPMEKEEGLGAGSGELVAKDWKFKARSAVRGVLGKGKAVWEDTKGWEELQSVMEGLKA